VLVALDQGHVPFDDAIEFAGGERAHREVRAEKRGEIDVRLGRYAAQERRLVLDRMRDEIGEAQHQAAALVCAT
jgi:hypothetical protein